MKNLVFTGGGTAGHVMPNLALAPRLRAQGWSLHYIGSTSGPERGLSEAAGIPFHAIATGKLRRYFSLKNFVDPFRVLWGAVQAFSLLGKLRPDLVFSKGGFVAVPVVYAAFLRRIPVVLHESDLTPGLANRLCLPLCRRICASFPETLEHLPLEKAILTGTPVREELLRGDKNRGLSWLGFSPEKPVLLMMGGSSGSTALNKAVRAAWPKLKAQWQVAHLCGKGHLDPAFFEIPGYRQYEFVAGELANLLAASDFVITRGGANALFEFMALRKPCLIIPLPALASRGDQILNAESFVRRGLARMLRQEDLTEAALMQELKELENQADLLRKGVEASDLTLGTEKVLEVIESLIPQPPLPR